MAYLNEQKETTYPLALKTALEAKNILEDAERKHIPIPACIRDGVYRTLAMMQVMNRQNCDSALENAGEFDLGEKNCAFMLFTATDVPMETGLIFQNKGKQDEAMTHFQKIVDLEKLTLVSPLAGGERDRISAINSIAQSVLKRKNRDMEEAIHYWKAGIQGAVALQSEHFFDEALATYNIMKYVWPGERDIEELDALTVHWSVAQKR